MTNHDDDDLPRVNPTRVDVSTDRVNPNKCPAVGTFFVQEINSNLGVIKELFDNGHEIGVTSVDGTPPATGADWQANLSRGFSLFLVVVHRHDTAACMHRRACAHMYRRVRAYTHARPHARHARTHAHARPSGHTHTHTHTHTH